MHPSGSPSMAKKLSSVLGIDIGSHSIKVCEVKTSGNQTVVSAVGVTPTPEGAVDYSGIYNADAVGLALKQVLTEAGAGSPNAVVTISGQHSVLVRVLSVPNDPGQTKDQLDQHMDYEISRNIPFAETTIQSDYKVLGDQDPNAAEKDVVMAMSPQSAIDTVVDCIKKSGRKPYAIDVEPLGLARVIAKSYPEWASGEGICVLDMGHATSTINVYRGSNLVISRPVILGGELITKEIANSQGISMSDAEDYKQNRFVIPEDASAAATSFDPFAVGGLTQSFDAGFNPGGYVPSGPGDFNPGGEATMGMPAGMGGANDDLAIDPVTGLPIEPPVDSAPLYTNDPFASSEPVTDLGSVDAAPVVSQAANDPVFDSVRGIFEDLVADLNRSIDYYRDKGGSVSRVVVCGGGAKLKGLNGYIERSVGIHTETFDPLKGVSLASKKASSDYVNEYRQQLAVAVGNGLHILVD
jgi:type IV pilus assembly protein PilM